MDFLFHFYQLDFKGIKSLKEKRGDLGQGVANKDREGLEGSDFFKLPVKGFSIQA